MLKKCLIGIAVILGLLLATAYFFFLQISAFGAQKFQVKTPMIVHLQAGQSAQNIWRLLKAEQPGLNDIYFKLWLRLHPEYAKVKAGYYEFTHIFTLEEAFSTINRGEQRQFSLSLIEGKTITQWVAALKNTPTLTQDLPEIEHLYDALQTRLPASSAAFCKNDMKSLEGCMLADTYFYAYQDSALSILQRAFVSMDTALDDAWNQRFQDIPLSTPYEALILASIIEKETAVASERTVIAGVFSNRLELNMRLQTDPTVIYGLGEEFDGNITRTHLRELTPYNTYRIKGLPPTPIAMAGKQSLQAAVQPAITDYIYFVAKGDGSHQFSTTLAEHNQAVATYQLNR
jgi:UPF0755 protein